MKLPPLMFPDHVANEMLLAGLTLGPGCVVTMLVKDPPPGSDTYSDGSGRVTVPGPEYEQKWREENEI
jgi:hypothetical protein